MQRIRRDSPLFSAAPEASTRFIFSLFGGHPRSIELLEIYMARDKSFEEDFKHPRLSRVKLTHYAESSIQGWCTTARIPNPSPAEVVALVHAFAFPEPVKLQDHITMESKYSWEDLISFSVLLNTRPSSFKTQFLPVFHLVLLKFTLSSAFVANCPKHILMLRSLWFSLYLQLCSARTDPQSPEMIHIYFECIRHLLYSSQRKTFTLEEHYHSDLWQKTQKASKKRKHQKEIFYCCTPNMKGKPKTNENWPPAQYMDKAKDYLFVPFESPLEEEPQEMKSLEVSSLVEFFWMKVPISLSHFLFLGVLEILCWTQRGVFGEDKSSRFRQRFMDQSHQARSKGCYPCSLSVRKQAFQGR